MYVCMYASLYAIYLIFISNRPWKNGWHCLCQNVCVAAAPAASEEGLVLVAHKPDTSLTPPPTGSHVRGSPLKAAAGRGDDEQEIDLLLPGTARFFV